MSAETTTNANELKNRIMQKLIKDQELQIDNFQEITRLYSIGHVDIDDVIDQAHRMYLSERIIWCIYDNKIPTEWLPYLGSSGCSLDEILTGFEDDIEERYIECAEDTAYAAIEDAVHWYKMEQDMLDF